MFEVGKKYVRRDGTYAEQIAEVIWADQDVAVVFFNGIKCMWRKDVFQYWRECKEPIKSIHYVYLWEGDKLVSSRYALNNDYDYEFISIIEMKYDIHNGLKVEIIPGIG
jgi:hypothetical protein